MNSKQKRSRRRLRRFTKFCQEMTANTFVFTKNFSELSHKVAVEKYNLFYQKLKLGRDTIWYYTKPGVRIQEHPKAIVDGLWGTGRSS